MWRGEGEGGLVVAENVLRRRSSNSFERYGATRWEEGAFFVPAVCNARQGTLDALLTKVAKRAAL